MDNVNTLIYMNGKRKRAKPVPLTALAPHDLCDSEPLGVPFTYRRAYSAGAEAIATNFVDGRVDIA